MLPLGHLLALDDWSAQIVLVELQQVSPGFWRFNFRFYLDYDTGITSGMKGTNLRYPLAGMIHRTLQPPLNVGNITQKPKYIEKIGFSRRVGADQEDATLERHVCPKEISPILQAEMGELHKYNLFYGRRHSQASQYGLGSIVSSRSIK